MRCTTQSATKKASVRTRVHRSNTSTRLYGNKQNRPQMNTNIISEACGACENLSHLRPFDHLISRYHPASNKDSLQTLRRASIVLDRHISIQRRPTNPVLKTINKDFEYAIRNRVGSNDDSKLFRTFSRCVALLPQNFLAYLSRKLSCRYRSSGDITYSINRRFPVLTSTVTAMPGARLTILSSICILLSLSETRVE